MTTHRFSAFFLMAFFMLCHAVFAAEPELQFGIAMHGSPLYGPEDTHLSYANPNAPKGGHIKIGETGTFDTGNPYNLKGKAAAGLQLIHDRLMRRVWDEPFTMYPLIAERIAVPEDRSKITFYLNKNARFNDNSPITVADILFSFETLKTHGRPNMRQVYSLVSNIETPNDHTITFELSEGFDRETVMILAMMPVLSKVYWKDKDFDTTTLEPPISSGPYTIETVDQGRSITYKRNPDYWAQDLMVNAGHHNFDKVTYDYYRDDDIALQAFKAGEFDFRRETDAANWALGYDDAKADIKKAAIPHGRPQKAIGFILNTRRPPFDDIRVRKALKLALDFNWLNQNLFHGLYEQVDSFFPNSELSHTANAPPSTQTQPHRTKLRQAASLLKEAGWDIQNGTRTNQNGEPLAFEVLINNASDEKIALHYKQALEKIGVNLSIRRLDSSAFTGRLRSYDYDMVLHFWLSSLSPGTEQILYWGCDAAAQEGRWNFHGICDEEIDKRALQIPHTKTRENLVTQMHKLDKILWDKHFFIPLYYAPADWIALSNHIHYPENTPLYGIVLETLWYEPSQ